MVAIKLIGVLQSNPFQAKVYSGFREKAASGCLKGELQFRLFLISCCEDRPGRGGEDEAVHEVWAMLA